MTTQERNQITTILFGLLLAAVGSWPVLFLTRHDYVFGGESFALVCTGLAYGLWRLYLKERHNG